MASKKASKPSPKSKPKPQQPSRLQNLAAKPTNFDDTIDDQLVDNSGVFRVTSALQQAQIGHDEDQSLRFPSDSLVIAAQRDGFREDGVTLDEAVTEHSVEDEATRAEKAARLATLAARARQRSRR
jgi:acetyl esterase/lipase